ncbi:hypothetical protein Tco_1184209 [Tanacetum coccineum]
MPSRTNGVLLIKAEQAKLNGDRWRIYYLKLHHRAVTLREPARESVEHGYTAAELAAELVSARMRKWLRWMEFLRVHLGHLVIILSNLGKDFGSHQLVRSYETIVFGGIMMLIFGLLEGLEMEALVDAMEVYGG